MPEPEQPQDWIFTFGAGHRAYAGRREPSSVDTDAAGFRLDYRYVVIHGTATQARSEMDRIFGDVWSKQYPDRDAASVGEFGLSELVIA